MFQKTRTDLKLHAAHLSSESGEAGGQDGVSLGVDVDQTLAKLGVLGTSSRVYRPLLVELRAAAPASACRHHSVT